MSNTAQNGMVFTIEDTNGTYKLPVAGDSNIVLFGGGKPTIDFGNEVIGKLADGTMNDGPVAGKYKKIEVPEFMCEVIGSTDETIEPIWWKLGKGCGWKVEDIGAGQLALVWDGVPYCATLSGNFLSIGCGGNGYVYAGRGMKGNMSIGWEGANGVITAKVGGMVGALESTTPVTGKDPYIVTGNDTGAHQKAGMYTCTLFGAVYQVTNLTIDPAGTVAPKPKNDPSGIDHSQINAAEARVTATFLKLDTGDTILDAAENNDYSTITIAGDEALGAKFDITFEGCQILSPSTGDIDGYEGWELDMTVKRAEIANKIVA